MDILEKDLERTSLLFRKLMDHNLKDDAQLESF